MFLKRDHFKRKTVFQPAICHRICDFSGGVGDSDIKGLNSAMGLPPVPYPTPVWWASVPTWWGGWKTLLPTQVLDWGNTGCMVPCENIQNLSPNLQTIWNQVKYHIHCHPGVTVLQYFNPIFYGTNVWAQLAIFLLGCWCYECCDMPSTMYTLQMSQMLWREFLCISNFHIINDWAGSWLRVRVNSWANIFSHRWLLMPWRW